jgi:ribonuclease HI
MKKSTILRALDALEQLCQTADHEDAVEILRDLASKIEEDEASTPDGEFSIPKEALDISAFTLYSDGACRGNPGPGSWGCLGQLPQGDVFFESSGFDMSTTNNRMELEGAIVALQHYADYLTDNELLSSTPVFLYSDSKYVVDGLEKWLPGWKARGWKKADKKAPENLELWQRLDELALGLPGLKLRWVKGHAGHPQNERCDRLANEVLDEQGF